VTRTVALYITGHGFGHAVRSAQVAKELLERNARVLVRTEAPAWLFPDSVDYLPSPGWPVDIGVAQRDGLEFDIAETRCRGLAFASSFDEHADGEAVLLATHNVDAVLGDVPALAFTAARRAGIPSLAQTNFGWDWIYAAWPGFEHVIATVQEGYRQADALLRLPLHPTSDDAFPAFQHIDDVPLVARVAQRSREEVRTAYGLPQQKPVVLLSFGGFEASGMDIGALASQPDYVFLLTRPMSSLPGTTPANVVRIYEQPADYVSLLAACDVVVTKPGYGIVADCLANRVPVLYTDRGPFREYDVLAHALETLGRARFVPRADILSANLRPHLEALAATPDRWLPMPLDGAQVVAKRILATNCHGI
jgi:hypothetical protein